MKIANTCEDWLCVRHSRRALYMEFHLVNCVRLFTGPILQSQKVRVKCSFDPKRQLRDRQKTGLGSGRPGSSSSSPGFRASVFSSEKWGSRARMTFPMWRGLQTPSPLTEVTYSEALLHPCSEADGNHSCSLSHSKRFCLSSQQS